MSMKQIIVFILSVVAVCSYAQNDARTAKRKAAEEQMANMPKRVASLRIEIDTTTNIKLRDSLIVSLFYLEEGLNAQAIALRKQIEKAPLATKKGVPSIQDSLIVQLFYVEDIIRKVKMAMTPSLSHFK